MSLCNLSLDAEFDIEDLEMASLYGRGLREGGGVGKSSNITQLMFSFTIWFYFLFSIIMTRNFPGFAIIMFLLNQFKATSHSHSKDIH